MRPVKLMLDRVLAGTCAVSSLGRRSRDALPGREYGPEALLPDMRAVQPNEIVDQGLGPGPFREMVVSNVMPAGSGRLALSVSQKMMGADAKR
jgi:hypothetical protein